jgi:hypothetical protein
MQKIETKKNKTNREKQAIRRQPTSPVSQACVRSRGPGIGAAQQSGTRSRLGFHPNRPHPPGRRRSEARPPPSAIRRCARAARRSSRRICIACHPRTLLPRIKSSMAPRSRPWRLAGRGAFRSSLEEERRERPSQPRAVALMTRCVLPLNRGGRATGADGAWCGGGDVGVGAQ